MAQTINNLPAMQETWAPSLGQEEPLEKEMATQNRIFAWRIPRTGGPGDGGLISESGRSPGGGNGNLLQRSCLGNPMDREAWWATVQRVKKSQTRLE